MNFLTIAFRGLLRNKLFAFINVVGLAIGITSSILIMLWVSDERSFDTFYSKADRLYQVWTNTNFDGKINSWTHLPLPTYEALKSADNNIKCAVVTNTVSDYLLLASDSRLIKKGLFASEEFLEMFELPLVEENASRVLDDPSSIVITESTAVALFGKEDPINKVIRVDNEHDFKVAGVLRDIPANSTFQFDFVLPWKYRENADEYVRRNKTEWKNYSFEIFVELNDPSQKADTESHIRMMLQGHGVTDGKPELFLYPLLRWHLHGGFENGVEISGANDLVQMFIVIAIFVIVIACINFMNLATAQSERRAREVGIRKSVGSSKTQLIKQFIGEATLHSLLAFVLAIVMVRALLPFYNNLVEKQLAIDYASSRFWLYSVLIILITGIVSGSYPAFYLSSFQPVKVLKGKFVAGETAGSPRKVLVAFQFGFSILLILGTIVIYQQIQLTKERQLGYNQENLITVNDTNEIEKNYRAIKSELLAKGVISGITKSNSSITDIRSTQLLSWPGKPDDSKVIFNMVTTEYDYTKTMDIKVREGRDFSEEFKGDSSAILINRAALRLMGLKDPLGTQLILWGGKRQLIGILDDVVMDSPYEPVKPLFVIFEPDASNAVTLRLNNTKDIQAAVNSVKTVFEKYAPSYPFDYQFADAAFQKKFTSINLTSDLATLFAALSIFITGMGLFGLALFTAEQRTKEIGIRKVLGASVSSIIRLLSKDFFVLVIGALVISSPLAWWLLNNYLQRFSIRTAVEWWIFPVTGVVVVLFAMTIVATLAYRAANVSPSKTLVSE